MPNNSEVTGKKAGNIAIIPARGGSKRIPKKNIKYFLNKPIIAYTIEAALSSDLFEEVIVSTDDTVIADVAAKYGASVPFFRSPENADDFAPTFNVIKEVLEAYEHKERKFNYGCCLYPTAPFITPELLQRGWEKLIKKSFTTVFPVLEYSFPIWRSMKVEGDNATFWWPENAVVRSQDLPKSYHDAGQFYWFDCAKLLEQQMLIHKNIGVLVINELDAHDIDTPSDWEVAEWKFKHKRPS